MFGENPVRGREELPPNQYRVQAKWKTIQGEGPFAGRVAYFIRLAGCNLRCWFCDTDFESQYENIETTKQISAWLDTEHPSPLTRLVVLTGGEPFRQDLIPLCSELALRHNCHVQIETAGTLWCDGLQRLTHNARHGLAAPQGVSVVVSPKAAKVHHMIFLTASAWKYVVRAGELDPDDGLPAFSTQQRGEKQRIARPPTSVRREEPERVYLQPMWDPDAAACAANVKAVAEACLKFGYRASLQQHRILGVE